MTYETPDCLEEESSDFYDEPESEHIERLHLSTKDAYCKFKGKYLTGYVDFSDRISRQLRSGYDARSGLYEYGGGGDDGEKEQPIEKCRRLQLEMDELMHELNDLSTDTAITKEQRQSYETIGDVVRNAKKVLVNLRLEQVLGTEATAATADADMKKLLVQIDEYKKSGGTTAAPKSASELVATTRIAELENKLHEIESVIGIEPEKLQRLSIALHSNNLLDAVQKVSTIAALLQPSQLDLIETRIGNLASKMDAIAAAASTNPNRDSSVDRKTLELYEIAKRAEPIAQALPNMLARMQALENLHKYGKRSGIFLRRFFLVSLFVDLILVFSFFLCSDQFQ